MFLEIRIKNFTFSWNYLNLQLDSRFWEEQTLLEQVSLEQDSSKLKARFGGWVCRELSGMFWLSSRCQWEPPRSSNRSLSTADFRYSQIKNSQDPQFLSFMYTQVTCTPFHRRTWTPFVLTAPCLGLSGAFSSDGTIGWETHWRIIPAEVMCL